MAKTQEELVEASVHVLYEVHMLEITANAIASEVTKGNMLNNAIVESFLVHARNLIHFLFPQNPHETDVLAVHFLKEPQCWESLRGALPNELETVRGRANKQVVHITYDRIEVVGEAKQWAYIDIFTEIRTLVEVFVRNANAELLHEDWAEIGPPL